MKGLLIFTIWLAGHCLFAQTNAITGKITGAEIGSLPSASVLLLKPGDSAVVAFTSTTAEGDFLLENINRGEYVFKVSFLGHTTFHRNLVFPSVSDTLQLGTILLQVEPSELKEVTIISAAPPVTVKEDTVEYRADSFKTRPNADVELLLKRLPGVEVLGDGNISVQGERVTRIFVDGKEFFGGDLRMATRNLPANAIENVQVIDGKSQESKFSGVDDGRREKVINLTLKEEARNTGFGKAMAGVGTDRRYFAKGNYNKFQEGSHVSVMGASGNVNTQSLALDGSGSAGTAQSGGNEPSRQNQNGIASNHMAGVNAFLQITPRTSITGNYLFNQTDLSLQNNLVRQNFLPQGTALYLEDLAQENQNIIHNGTIEGEYNDSIRTIKVASSFGYTTTRVGSRSSRQSFSVENELVNAGERTALTRIEGFNFDADLFYGRKFKKKGRTVTITNRVGVLQDESKGQTASLTRFEDGEERQEQQLNLQDNQDVVYEVRVAFTEPISAKQFLQASYSVSNRSSESELEVFDIVREIRQLNAGQSTQYALTYLFQNAGVHYRVTDEKYNLSVGVSGQRSRLDRTLQGERGLVRRRFVNVLPNLSYNWRLSRNTRLNAEYSTSVREPSINQLQPVVSRYDPLNLYIGNPDLRPQYTHQGKLKFNTSNKVSGIFLAASLNFTYSTNPITAAVSVDERQVRTTQYVNVKQSNSQAALLNLGIPVKKISSRFSLNPYVRQGQSVNLLNGVEGFVRQRSFGTSIDYSFTYKEHVDFTLGSDLNRTDVQFEKNRNRNQVFLNTLYKADATVYFLKNFFSTVEFTYATYRNNKLDFNQTIPTLDFSLSRQFLKNKQGEIKLSGLNLFNRQERATQFATQNYIEQSVTNYLGSIYMISLIYNLK